ncbi:MAG: hypothetical protein JW815_06420, partial [Candidatus Bathyarchaeota archaeon]|nr:hypothetical protein [Candidatus Bathyarchaeum sp.]
MDPIEKKVFTWLFGEDTVNWNKSESKLAVLAVILQKSRKQNQAITAISLQQIKAGLEKQYDKD